MSSHASSRTLVDLSVKSVAGSGLATPLRVAMVVLGFALTAIAAQFTTTVPFTAVPLTLTPIAVLLTGAALGSRLGAFSQVMYVVAGVMGFAVFSPSAILPPGLGRLVGPTGGYLMAYPAAAFVTGWLSERGWDRRYLSSLGAMAVGLAVIYIGGVSWLSAAVLHSLSGALNAGLLPFVALDVLKITAAAMILPRVWRRFDSRLG